LWPFLVGETVSQSEFFAKILDINAWIRDGKLLVNFRYPTAAGVGLDVPSLIANCEQTLNNFVKLAISPSALKGGLTPSDFPLAKSLLSQTLIDSVVIGASGDYHNVQDVYPLSPMQEGMLFHSLLDPSSEHYINQLSWSTGGPHFNVALYKQCWEALVASHSILRSRFLWNGVNRPLQIVEKSITLNWSSFDWRDADASTTQDRWASLLEQLRKEPVDFANLATLMKFVLVRTQSDYLFAWTHHHIYLDGTRHYTTSL